MFYSSKRTSYHKVTCSLIILFIISLLVLPLGVLAKSPEGLPTPTLVWPQDLDQTISEKPVIKGITKNDTSIEVYIDEQLNGLAKVKNSEQGTASFAYIPFLPLKSGKHLVSIRAWDSNTQAKSKFSEAVTFVVEEPYPAPTLFTPVVNEKTVSTRPFIVGVALNNSLVKIFIDDKLDGQFRVQNSDSGVASFSYQPFLDLDPKKEHLVYATATNAKGKESGNSNVIGFLVKAKELPKTIENLEVVSADEAQKANVAESVEEKASQKEEVKGEAVIAATENKNDGIDNTNQESEQKTEEKQSGLIWWVILAIVVVIIIVNLRGRGKKDASGGLKGLAEISKKEDKSSEKSNSETKSQQDTLFKKEGSIEGGRKMPPPPPSK